MCRSVCVVLNIRGKNVSVCLPVSYSVSFVCLHVTVCVELDSYGSCLHCRHVFTCQAAYCVSVCLSGSPWVCLLYGATVCLSAGRSSMVLLVAIEFVGLLAVICVLWTTGPMQAWMPSLQVVTVSVCLSMNLTGHIGQSTQSVCSLFSRSSSFVLLCLFVCLFDDR